MQVSGMADLPTTTMAERLRWARICAGLTGSALAERAGITPATISRLEHSKVEATARTLHALASALGVPMAWIWIGEGNPPDPEEIRQHVGV